MLCLAAAQRNENRENDRTSKLVGYSSNRFLIQPNATSTITPSISSSILPFGNLLLSLAFSHSPFGDTNNRMREMRFGGRVGSRMNTLFFQYVGVSKSGKGPRPENRQQERKGTYSSPPSSNHQSILSFIFSVTFPISLSHSTTNPTIRSARTSTISAGVLSLPSGLRNRSICPYRRRRSEFGGSPYVFHCKVR